MDKKLHVIAAPGAGKTTLGIETIARLNRPVLILCPTNTIKNQWKERICNSFLEEKYYGIVSTDIRNPKFITVITYQALLAAFCGKIEEEQKEENNFTEEETDDDSITGSKRFNQSKADKIIKILKEAHISLLCFDEAHHLRKEWWKALTYLVEELAPEQTLALTATPPYDADLNEWQRYEELCGTIDEVISIPELVKNGDLCPHQDFIHFSSLRDSENDVLRKYNAHIGTFLSKIMQDRALLLYLSGMSFLNPTDSDIEKIFDNPEFYISIASLLKAQGIELPKAFLQLFDARQAEIPRFSMKQAKIFLNAFLITKTAEFPGMEGKIEDYTNLAKKLGLVQNKKIVLNDSKKYQKQISNSLGKLDSIVQIVELENNSLGKNLRMVILADYIKANDVDNSHLGVIPIWRTLKSKFADRISLGVLCGSLIILPKNLTESLYKLLDEYSVSADCISVSDYPEDGNFIKITPKDSAKHCIVSMITEMFNRGYVTVLVGTQALLGEGWDAPCINSLILSSTVSSYMLSNQMRGRAIRIDKNNPEKISNIWHLASIRVSRPSDFMENIIFQKTQSDVDTEICSSDFYDLDQLSKRFEGFEAPSYFENNEITSGIDRVLSKDVYKNIPTQKEHAFLRLNKITMEMAKNRQQTKDWWTEALYLGYNRSMMSLSTGVDTPCLTAKSLVYHGYKELFYTIASLFLVILSTITPGRTMIYILPIVLIVFICCMLVIAIKYLKTGSVEGVMKQVAIVHLEALSYQGLIKTSLKNVGLSIQNSQYGVFVTCKNLPVEENNLLIKALQEFLDPIDNPRYIMIRKEKFANFINQIDYFAIPMILSSKKKDVDIFKQLWNKYIDPCDIAYTRNLEGRKLLLKARKIAFSSSKREKSKKLSKWQ